MKFKKKNVSDGSHTDATRRRWGGKTRRSQESLFASVLWKCLVVIELNIARYFYQKTKNS